MADDICGNKNPGHDDIYCQKPSGHDGLHTYQTPNGPTGCSWTDEIPVPQPCWCGMPHDDAALREFRAWLVKQRDSAAAERRGARDQHYIHVWQSRMDAIAITLAEFDRSFPRLAAEAQTGEQR